jgi:hypothetical protein
MRQSMIAAVVAALISTTAVAGNAIIENEYVRAGVNETTGTFGSGGSTRPGLQYDSTGTSTFPADSAQGDYLTPGSPFDGFAVKVDGTNYSNNNSGSSAIAGAWVGTPSAASAIWQGGITGVFSITNTYSLPSAQQYIDITSAITAQQAMTTLSFGRFIDPDAMPAAGDTSATDNVLGYGTIPTANVVFSEATVSRYALGLYSTDSNVAAGIQGWSQVADAYVNADGVCGVGVIYCNGDDTIGLSWTWTGVSIGDILTANYAYIFGPSAFGAASAAIAGGAGGGANITTGTLVDIGSATDVAAGAAATPVITTATIIDTTRPVLTAGITHHTATETTTVQTIARETTTTTTTPMRTATYTDGVETSSVVATSTIASAITDPGSFVGRTDQIANAQTMQNISTRGLSFDGATIINDNASNGNTRGFAVGGNKELDNGVTVGAGLGRLTNNTTSTDGSASAEGIVLNLHVDKKVERGTVSVGLTHGMMDLTTTRTIGDFANAGTTAGTNTSVGIRFVADGEKVRPVVGYTRGVRSVDGYTETGSIQSIRTVAESTDYYGYATIGAQATLAPGVEAQALRHTDGVSVLSLNVNREWKEDKVFTFGVSRSFSDLDNVTSISGGISWKF